MHTTVRPFLTLILAIGLLLTACGDDASDTSTEAATTSEPATSTEAPETTVEATTSTEPETTTTSTEPEPETTTTTTTEAAAIDGEAIYVARCANCHGADGDGGRGPSLIHHLATHADREKEFVQIVEGGSGMPAFGDRLSEDEINAVIDYYTEAFGPAS